MKEIPYERLQTIYKAYRLLKLKKINQYLKDPSSCPVTTIQDNIQTVNVEVEGTDEKIRLKINDLGSKPNNDFKKRLELVQQKMNRIERIKVIRAKLVAKKQELLTREYQQGGIQSRFVVFEDKENTKAQGGEKAADQIHEGIEKLNANLNGL